VEHDQDRRDSPDAEDASSLAPDSTQDSSAEGAAGPGGTDDATGPTSEEPTATDEAAAPAPTTPAEAASTSEFESWPSQDAASQAAAEQPGEPAAAPGWPTEPPAAGSADPDAWPTEPPERGDESLREPEWGSPSDEAAVESASTSWNESGTAPGETAVPEPPPSEVEAYPAAMPPSDESGDAAATAAAVAGAHSVPAAESATGESTLCPRCGTENRPGLAFCRNCGQRLIAAGVASTLERPGTPEGTMACPRCGTHNRAGVAFCQNCGANLRGTAPGYVPPAVATDVAAEPVAAARGGAVLGPVVLLIGLVGIVTGYLLPFLYGSGSLFERASGPNGYGVAFWSAYPEVGAQLADQVYYGLTGPIPLLGLLLLVLAFAGFFRATPGRLQTVGLAIALLWSVGLIILFVVVELAANWNGDLVGMLRVLTPAGIIFFLSSLIVLIGTLTRFARS
jgi:double zinc ribbon protein